MLQGDAFRVRYDATCATIYFEGYLKLSSLADYVPISTFLAEVAHYQKTLTLDFRELQFLNSAGMSMLFRFVVQMRHERMTHLCVQGSQKVMWQTRSLKNLQRLMPALSLEWG